ncbi:TspO/MBR family protein [Chryseolinea lacunae]|uniref:Tryptophan-rich sensory protein n=1 Tax=Chryseolinea lacunae TaxID=2801331 RepID=A0ABS1KTL4_9BACT|nr:TspO/MBR family protein [Chryseolinea lacunae]MBL0741651.1 tryptophan-rich sensory protein [Chryseolinea lacunae]
MNRNTMLALASVILFCGVLTVNTLANVLPINGLSTKQVSDLYPSLFTPAGLTFSIWSVIYVLLIGFVVLMWSRKQDVFIATLLPWFMASCVLNMSWILAWHYLMPALSVVIMLTLLFSLSQIFMLLQSHRAVDMKEKIFVFLPFTLYFGWICVATIANVSALLVSVRWEGGFLSPEAWTVVMMCVAATLSAFVALRFRATAFVVVVLWALLGIYLRWNTTDYAAINGTAIVLLIGLTIVFVLSLRKQPGTHA